MGALTQAFNSFVNTILGATGKFYPYLTNIFGICAMLITVFSYQARKRISIISLQLIGHVFWVSYLILNGAFVGAVLNFVSMLRCIMFSFKDKYKWANNYGWLAFFLILNGSVSIMTWSAWYDFLPLVGVTLFTIGFYMSNEKHIRFISMFALPLWLIYGILTKSYFAVMNDSISFISLIIAIIRYSKIKNETAKIEE